MDAIPLQFPYRGLNKSASLERQAQFTSSDMENMRASDPMTQRMVGSRRSGLGRWDQSDAMGSGGMVNLLAHVEFEEETSRKFVEDFPDSGAIDGVLITDTGGLSAPSIDQESKLYYALAETWAAETEYVFEQLVEPTTPNGFYYRAGGIGTSDTVEPTWPTTIGNTVVDGEVTWTCVAQKFGGFVNTTTDTSQNITGTLMAVPHLSEWSGTYRMYLLCNATPDPAVAGVTIELVISGAGNINLSVTKRNASTTTGTWTNLVSLGFVDAVEFYFLWEPGTTNLTVRANGEELLNQNIGAAPAGGGDVVGWSMQPSDVGVRMQADRFTYVYHHATVTEKIQAYRTVAAAGGKVYRESAGFGFIEIDSSISVRSDVPLYTAQLRQKLYIADWGVVFEDGNALVGNTGAGPYRWQFETNPSVNLTSLGVDPTNHVVEIVSFSNSADNAKVLLGAYEFTVVSTGAGTNNTIRLVRQTTALPSSANVNLRIVRGTKVYDPEAGTLGLLLTPSTVLTEAAEYGALPANANLITGYRNRLVLSSGKEFTASRIDNPLDFFVGGDEDDAARAWSDTVGAFASIGQSITALFAHGKDRLIFATAGGIVRMAGDIADGGYLEAVNADFGVASQSSFCTLQDGSIVFLSHRGLYRIGVSSEAVPAPLFDTLPNEFRTLDPQSMRTTLVFDPVRNLIHIFTGYEAATRSQYQWVFDLRTGAFFRDSFDSPFQCIAAALLPGYFRRRFAVAIGGADGHIYYKDRVYETDSGTSFQGWATFGPYIPAGPAGDKFLLNQAEAIMGQRTSEATLSVIASDTPETGNFAAPLRGVRYQKALSAGINRGMFPKVRARTFVVKVSGTVPWQFENGRVWIEPAGWV